jgi:Xaa-Pro aminopeptidase
VPFRPVEKDERARRMSRVRSRAAELGLDAVVFVAVAQISENRGKGWLSYLFGYTLEHRYGYGVLSVAGEEDTMVFPEGMTWALEDIDRSLYRCPPYHSEQPLGDVLVELLGEWGLAGSPRIGIVGLAEMLPVVDYRRLREALPAAELIEVAQEMESVRVVKSPAERAEAEESNRIAEAGYATLLELVGPGVSVRELGAELYRTIFREGAVDHVMLSLAGAGGRSGPTLIAPTGSERVLAEGDVFTFSMELTGQAGYWVEHARMFALGSLDPGFERQVEVAIEALARFETAARAGARGGDVYRAVDEVVTAAGFHQGHTPGHSIGQDVLEMPRIAPYEAEPLPEGAIVAFHPHVLDAAETMGAYLANVFVIGADGAEALSAVPVEPVRVGAPA